jgi:serine/threonine-protein kinase
VKVSDFGIAWSTMKSHTSELGAIKGKVPYMPPEQVRGAALDGRADVYALGAVLYEAVCGRPPFVGPAGALIPLVVEGRYARPRDVSPDVPEDLEAIILKAMSLRPEDRFQTAAAMRDELEELALKRAWRLSSTDLSGFAEVLDEVPVERTPEAEAFDIVLGAELCKVADGQGGDLSVFTSALPAPGQAPQQDETVDTTPDVPVKVDEASLADKRPSVPGSMLRPSLPTRSPVPLAHASSVPPAPATRISSSPAPAPRVATGEPPSSTMHSSTEPSSRPATVDSVLSVPGLPKRRGRAAALYAAAVVAVAVGAGLAARSGSGGAETNAPAAAAPPSPVSPPSAAPSPEAPPTPGERARGPGKKDQQVEPAPPSTASGAGEGGGAVVPTQGTPWAWRHRSSPPSRSSRRPTPASRRRPPTRRPPSSRSTRSPGRRSRSTARTPARRPSSAAACARAGTPSG